MGVGITNSQAFVKAQEESLLGILSRWERGLSVGESNQVLFNRSGRGNSGESRKDKVSYTIHVIVFI